MLSSLFASYSHFSGKLAQGYMDAGKLVPDSVVIGMIKDHINAPEPKQHGVTSVNRLLNS